MHMPQKIGLVGKAGDIEIGKVAGASYGNGVFQIHKQKQRLVFNGIAERPVLSLTVDSQHQLKLITGNLQWTWRF